MSQTKKLLVPFDPEKPEAPSSDFLIPVRAEGRVALRGMASGNEQPYGLMVYLGRAITENDLLRRLVNSPVEIENMDEMLAALRAYVEKLQSLHIGNVVRLRADVEDGFQLELVARIPSAFRRPGGADETR